MSILISTIISQLVTHALTNYDLRYVNISDVNLLMFIRWCLRQNVSLFVENSDVRVRTYVIISRLLWQGVSRPPKALSWCFVELLIGLSRCESRKLRRQTMRIEHRPIHHSRDSRCRCGIASYLSPWRSRFNSDRRIAFALYGHDNLSNSWGTNPITVATRRQAIWFASEDPNGGSADALNL